MKSNYGKGHKLPEYTQIFPAEALLADDKHDYAIFCALLAASRLMTKVELRKVAEQLSLRTRNQVAGTCNKIVQEHKGFIWMN